LSKPFSYTLMVTLLWLMSVCTANRLVRPVQQFHPRPNVETMAMSHSNTYRMKAWLFANNHYPHGLEVRDNTNFWHVMGPYRWTRSNIQTNKDPDTPTQTHMHVDTHSCMHNIYSEQPVLFGHIMFIPMRTQRTDDIPAKTGSSFCNDKRFLCKWTHGHKDVTQHKDKVNTFDETSNSKNMQINV
jgi:hypothetical protein